MGKVFFGDIMPRGTNIIDNNGRRYKLINDKPDVPEQIQNYEMDSVYQLEAREAVFVTYLFEKLDDSARSLDVHFISMNQDGDSPSNVQPIHVVLQ
jgi:hypothetical protein